jgi:hypothetical protein
MGLLPDLKPLNNVDCTNRTFVSSIVSSSSVTFHNHTQYFHTNCAVSTKDNARPSPIILRNSPEILPVFLGRKLSSLYTALFCGRGRHTVEEVSLR